MVCIDKCVSLGIGTYLVTKYFYFQLSVFGEACHVLTWVPYARDG